MINNVVSICGISLVSALALVFSLSVHAGGENLIVVTTTADGMDNTDGQCSLREALHNANTNSRFSPLLGECNAGSAVLTDVIVLQSGEQYLLTVPGNGENQGDLNIHSGPSEVDLRIRSNTPEGARAIIRQNVMGQRVMAVHGARVELEGLTIRGGNTSGSGGGISSSQGHLTLRNVSVANNIANNGGGIDNLGYLRIEDSEIQFNEALNQGGGIMHIGSFTGEPDLIISGGKLLVNKAKSGAGVLNDSGWVVLQDDVEFIQNISSEGNGGGVHAVEGVVQTNNAHFSGNTASGNGGGLSLEGEEASITIVGGFFHGNHAVRGGAVHLLQDANSTMQITGADLRDNTASDRGGALYAFNVTISNSHLENNAANMGGAVYALREARLIHCEAVDNRAMFNGGAVRGRHVVIGNSVIRDNHAQQHDGGGLWAERGIRVWESTLRNNTAGRDGGGLYLLGDGVGSGRLERTAVAFNSAANQGGGLWLKKSDGIQVQNTTISGNLAGQGGGVYLEESTTMYAWHMTLTSNMIGQDIYKMGTLIMGNSILGTPGQPSCVVSLDNFTIQSLGHNLSSDPLCFGLDQTGDQLVADPMLATLADNGGNTLTHALLDGSPALGAADLGMCMQSPDGGRGEDQRGGERPVNGACDIGAYESGAIHDRIFANGFQAD